MTTRLDRLPTRPPWLLALLGALLTFATWPVPTLVPGPGLDPSWQAGLHLAVRQQLDFGSDVLFTYGPLGFLAQSRLFSSITGGLAFLFTAAVHAAWCGLLVVLAMRRLPVVVAIPVAYLITSIAGDPAEIAAIGMFAVALTATAGPRRLPLQASVAMGAVAGLLLLVKFNSGLAIGLLGLSIPLHDREGSAPRVLAYTASAVVASAAGWFLTDNPLDTVVPFLLGSLDLAAGYTDAMASEDSRRLWEYVAAGVLVLLIPLAATAFGVLPSGRRRVLLGAVYGIGAWLLFKRGFTRHDAHSVSFFLGCAVVPLTIGWRPGLLGRVLPATLATAGAAAAMAAYAIPLSAHFSPLHRSALAVDQARTMIDGERRSFAAESGRQDILRSLAIDPSLAELLRGRTTHVDPFETSAVWALRLAWRPPPAFQAYFAYTDAIDDASAAALASPTKGPEAILTPAARPAIDGRNPDFESPGYFTAMLCHYREVAATATWQVLERTEPRCGPTRSLGTARLRPGKALEVPVAEEHEIVFARMHLDRSLGERVGSLVFKPLAHPQVTIDGRRYRLVAATAGNPLLLRVPAALGYTAPYGGVVHTSPAGRIGVEGESAAIEFFAMPLDPASTSREVSATSAAG